VENIRIAYGDFQKHLLFRIAVLSGGDFERPILAEEAASHIDGRFPTSWVKAVAVKLSDRGLIHVSHDLDSGLFDILNSNLDLAGKLARLEDYKDISRIPYLLTEAGLEEAERSGSYLGYDLWDEIDLLEANSDEAQVAELGRIVGLDRSSSNFEEVESEVGSAIQSIRSDNELMATSEGSQRIAELEAGRRLIQADQVNESLAKRTLIPALQWAAKKVRDDGAGVAIKLLVTKILTMLT